MSLALKHALDRVGAAVLLLLLAPLLLLVAAAVLVSMGRPVLFVQERVGLRGRVFRMLKFRSMVNDAEQAKEALWEYNEASGPVFKMSEDPRATPLGRILRAAYLDELPQLFNVLAGSMSLVGPRPLPIPEQDQIRGWQSGRLAMKPGLTGLWQVSRRESLSFDDWMRLDIEYVERWSTWLDIAILLRTPAIVVRGAAGCWTDSSIRNIKEIFRTRLHATRLGSDS